MKQHVGFVCSIASVDFGGPKRPCCGYFISGVWEGPPLVRSWFITPFNYLVGGFKPSEKKLVSWDDYSQYVEK